MPHEMPSSQDVKKAEETMTDSQKELSSTRDDYFELYRGNDPELEKRLSEISSIDFNALETNLVEDMYSTQGFKGVIKGYEVAVSKPSIGDNEDYDVKKWTGTIKKVGEASARPMSPEEAQQVYFKYLWAAKFLLDTEENQYELRGEVQKELEYSPHTKDLLAD